MAALLDFGKDAFDEIVCADRPPVLLGKVVKGKAGVHIPVKTASSSTVAIVSRMAARSFSCSISWNVSCVGAMLAVSDEAPNAKSHWRGWSTAESPSSAALCSAIPVVSCAR